MNVRAWLTIFAVSTCAACDGGPVATPDAAMGDAAMGDTIAPSVRDTTPAEGAVDVARDAELVIRFSEPMARGVGSLRFEPGGESVGGPTWDATGSTARVTPLAGWPAGEAVVSLHDFTDVAGNPLPVTMISFTTVDDVGPRVISASPSEGATVSARTTEIVLTFDEPMRTSSGTLDVLGGAATIGGGVWSNGGTTITFPVADLEYLRDYDATLRGFFDTSGNRLDGRGLLEDGVLDFSTGPDTDAPRVVRAEPGEGQVDVNPADTMSILVTFDEPMDATMADVSLSDGTTTTPLVGTWAGSSRTLLRVDVAGLLAFGESYALDLGALLDRAGNPIDPVTYLVDGELDFTVGLDAFRPFVMSSSPTEGDTDVGYIETTEISLRFSEAMDTTVVTAMLTGGPAPIEVTVRWTSDTEALVDVDGRLRAGTAYALDLTGMRDTRGNMLDPTHHSLGDGHLDFTTSLPIGEGCRDPLTTAQATESSGAFVWTIGSLDGSIRDGGTASCDPDTAANGSDLLIAYDKISPDVAAGGRHLRIVVDGSTSTSTGNSFDVAVMTGAVCDPLAAPARCHSNASFHQLDLDLPAGPVWIWVSRTTSSTTAVSATVTVSEVDPPRIEGDSCELPFTTASAIYTPPSGPGTAHHFAIPLNHLRGADLGTRPAIAPNAFVCDTAAGHGIDGVIRFDKPDDASVLRVTARRPATSGDSFSVMVVDQCDAAAPGVEMLACRTGVTTTAASFLVDVPAGPVHVWIGDTLSTVTRSSSVWAFNPAIDVDIEVIPDVTSGEICSRALTATLGPNAVAGTSDVGLDRPSCFGATSNVEWYRLRTTSQVLLADTDTAAGIALFDPAGAREISCLPNGLTGTLTRVLPIGTDVCIAVEMGRGVTSLDLREQSYTGLGSTPPVELGILRPFSTTGTEESITSDAWMGVTDGNLLMKHTSTAVLDVSRTGGERAVRRGSTDGITSTMIGRTGVVAAGALFSFSTTTTTTAQRVTRIWDGRSAIWSPVAWDLAPTYVASAIMAAAPSGASDIVFVTDSTTNTVFYRISALAPSAPQLLGTSTRLRSTRGIAVDDQFVYLQSTVDTLRGIYRVPLSNLAAEPTRIALGASFSTSTTQATAMSVDRLTAPMNLYVRNANGEVEVIIDPAGAAPFYLGPVIDLGTSSDFAMTLDHATGQLFLFETETVSTGNFVRYDP